MDMPILHFFQWKNFRKSIPWLLRIQNRKAGAKQPDGSYVLKTDRQDLTTGDIWRSYIPLTRMEDASRDMKSPLMERLISHQLQHRKGN
jgi:hypothetical protein